MSMLFRAGLLTNPHKFHGELYKILERVLARL